MLTDSEKGRIREEEVSRQSTVPRAAVTSESKGTASK